MGSAGDGVFRRDVPLPQGLHGQQAGNAEDPANGFRPCPGRTEFLHLPGGPGVRVDTGLYEGCPLPPYYDSLAAKVMVHAAAGGSGPRR